MEWLQKIPTSYILGQTSEKILKKGNFWLQLKISQSIKFNFKLSSKQLYKQTNKQTRMSFNRRRILLQVVLAITVRLRMGGGGRLNIFFTKFTNIIMALPLSIVLSYPMVDQQRVLLIQNVISGSLASLLSR